jgi:transcriptional regulator with XRE-family HTH domain
MGRASRARPANLYYKLYRIRDKLGLTQDEMLERLFSIGRLSPYFTDRLSRSSISAYEQDRLEPPLPVLVSYARVANVWVDVLIDDERDLPDEIPAERKSGGKKRPPIRTVVQGTVKD